MEIPDEIRKCVIFIGCEDKVKEGEYILLGSAFLLGRSVNGIGKQVIPHVVTAAHTLRKAKERGAARICLRLNLRNGFSRWEPAEFDEWTLHPNGKCVDVAIRPIRWNSDYDHTTIPENMILSEEVILEEKIGIGNEVFITGLFSHRHRTLKDTPIVRAGNIAAMDDELVWTDDLGKIQAYLVEARSIGGLSGSPVFVYLGTTRFKEGGVQLRKGLLFFMMGLIHGHYDVDETKIDDAIEDNKRLARVNMGIAIVVPWHRIVEVFAQPKLRQYQETVSNGLREDDARLKSEMCLQEQLAALSKSLKLPKQFGAWWESSP